MYRRMYPIFIITLFVFLQTGCASFYTTEPLQAAAINGQTNKVKTLLIAGANPNIEDSSGLTPLMKAAGGGSFSLFVGSKHIKATPVPSQGNVETVRLLLEYGANPDLQDKWGTTALVFASQFGNNESVSALLSAGANLKLAIDDSRVTAFLMAINNGHVQVGKILLKAGVDIEESNKYGQTALFSSSYNGDMKTVQFLLDKGAKVNVRDSGGHTPLSNAAFMGRLEIVKLLLQYGANPNEKDVNGKTPLKIARERGHPQVADLLSSLPIS